MESVPTLKYLFAVHIPHHRRSNVVGIKCLSLSLCAFYAEDSLFEENSMAQFTFFGFYET